MAECPPSLTKEQCAEECITSCLTSASECIDRCDDEEDPEIKQLAEYDDAVCHAAFIFFSITIICRTRCFFRSASAIVLVITSAVLC